jgi:hypothetical protein
MRTHDVMVGMMFVGERERAWIVSIFSVAGLGRAYLIFLLQLRLMLLIALYP